MSLSDLADELRRQAEQSGQITLDEQTVRSGGLNPPALLDQLIRDSFDLGEGEKLLLTIAPADIPAADATAETLVVVGQGSFLNVERATVTVEFVAPGGALDFTLQANLVGWKFSTSFPSLAGMIFDRLALTGPAFIFSTRAAESWGWGQADIALLAGLNFASHLGLTDALRPVADLLANFSPATDTAASLLLSGPIDIQEGERKSSLYPDLKLKAAISDDAFDIFFLSAGGPFVELALAEILDAEAPEDEEASEYQPGLFLGLGLALTGKAPLAARAEILEDARLLVLGVASENPGEPLTLENVVELMAGQRFEGFLPDELESALSEVAFKGFSASLNLGPQTTITSIHAALGSTGGLQVFDEFEVERFDFIWSIQNPGGSNTMSGAFHTQFEFFPEVFKGLFDVEITTDLIITGRFTGSVSFDDLVRGITGGQLSIPDGFASLTFSDFHLFMDIGRSSFSLEASADLTLTLLEGEGVGFRGTRFGIGAAPPSGGGPRAYTGFIQGILMMGETEVYVSANHPSAGAGWLLEGHSLFVGMGVNLTALVADLFDPFGVSLPSSAPDFYLLNLALSFNTQTKEFNYTCEGAFTIDGQDVDISLTVKLQSSGGTYTAFFGGRLRVGALMFEIHFRAGNTSKLFVATYAHSGAQQNIRIKELVGYVSSSIAGLVPEGLEVDLKDVILALNQDSAGTHFLFGLDVSARLNLSELPLVGQKFPPELTVAVDDLQLLVNAKALSVTEVDAINREIPEGVTKLPSQARTGGGTTPAEGDIAIQQGLNVSASMNFGGAPQVLSLPVASAGSAPAAQTTPATPATQASAPTVTASDNAKWFALQKTFGPVYFEKVGVKYQDEAVWFLLNASLSVAGLTLSLDGLAFGSPLSSFSPRFDLRGLGLDYKGGGAVEIGGAFLRIPKEQSGKTYDEYDGAAIVKAEQLTLSAIGSYAELDGHPSLFVYAVLDYPLGGPSFFFVTGLAAGFGYNRALLIPPIEQVAQFPLVADAISGAAMPRDLGQKLASLQRYIPPSAGDYFLAAGIKFTSFKLIDSFALLTVSFGTQFEINLLGLSTLIVPTPIPGQTVVTPLAEVQMALRATFNPAQGFLGVSAQLTSASYILSRDCHLTGGFAFYSWFSGEHEGDFVLTLGGYHPEYGVPAHYPKVPRLGFNWRVDSKLSVKGDAYYALTAAALMAGGSLQATWDDGDLKAHFNASADFIIYWQPYHYDAKISVDVGVSYTYNLFGRHTLNVDVGADLHIWGPEFTGKAHIKLSIISFDITFGSSPRKEFQPIGWDAFRDSFLPKDKDGRPAICAVSVADGLVSAPQDEAGIDWVVNPKDFTLVTDSVIPSKAAFKGGAPIAVAGNETKFGIGSMAVASGNFSSSHTITIVRRREGGGEEADEPVEGDFEFRPVLKNVPVGLWGETLTPDMNGPGFVRETLTGFEVRPAAQPAPGVTADVARSALQYDGEDVPVAYTWGAHAPFVALDLDDEARRRVIEDSITTDATDAERARLLGALGVIADIELGGYDDSAFLIAPQIEAVES